jgi:hypothetical protein
VKEEDCRKPSQIFSEIFSEILSEIPSGILSETSSGKMAIEDS